jgi:hypothetical protein
MLRFFVLCVVAACPCVWAQDANQPAPTKAPAEMTSDKTDAILKHIEQTDPQRAATLRELRKSDPTRFKEEMREYGREQLISKMDDGVQPKHHFGEVRERLEQRHNEFIAWLEKNHPVEATHLAQLKDKNPDQYMQQLKPVMDKYGRIAVADKENPALATVLRQDLDAKQEIAKVVEQIRLATDDAQKKTLNQQLQTLVAKRFDLIMQQKELRFQELNKRLENLKQEVAKQETDLQKFKGRKDQEVNKRVNELLSQSEEFKWD